MISSYRLRQREGEDVQTNIYLERERRKDRQIVDGYISVRIYLFATSIISQRQSHISISPYALYIYIYIYICLYVYSISVRIRR